MKIQNAAGPDGYNPNDPKPVRCGGSEYLATGH